MQKVDIPIGTEFYFNGWRIKCLETKDPDDSERDCDRCCFQDKKSKTCAVRIFACAFEDRVDDKDVYFRKISRKPIIKLI